MQIDFTSLGHTFLHKPLLIGGKAMEYYGLRQAGADIDYVVHPTGEPEELPLMSKTCRGARNPQPYGDITAEDRQARGVELREVLEETGLRVRIETLSISSRKGAIFHG